MKIEEVIEFILGMLFFYAFNCVFELIVISTQHGVFPEFNELLWVALQATLVPVITLVLMILVTRMRLTLSAVVAILAWVGFYYWHFWM